jgi:hypothetical protein
MSVWLGLLLALAQRWRHRGRDIGIPERAVLHIVGNDLVNAARTHRRERQAGFLADDVQALDLQRRDRETGPRPETAVRSLFVHDGSCENERKRYVITSACQPPSQCL